VRRYLSRTPRREYRPNIRLVHNFFPGSPDIRRPRERGRGFWITDEPGTDERCYCGWLDGREHYGAGAWVDVDGCVHHRREDDVPLG
jgi:hypothetical protein